MLVDACQSVPHMVGDVMSIDADFPVAKVMSSPSSLQLKSVSISVSPRIF